MLEQLFFITISIIIFGLMFYKMIKKNETGYIYLLILGAIGIIIDGIGIVANTNTNIFLKVITYIMSIIIPGMAIILEHKNVDIINWIKFLQVKLYLRSGDLKKAKDILLTIIEKNPNNYNAHKFLAEIYEKEGGIRKAIDEYVRCIEINKKDYDSYYKVALLLNDLEKKEEAIEMLYGLLDKKPDYYNGAVTLGDLLIETEKYKDAVSVLTEALKYNPTSFDLNYGLGMAYTMLNDFKSAKECYEKAVELNSLYYNTKYSLAQIAMLYKDLDSAEEYFEQTIEDEELEADSYFELAKIKLMKGEKETAIKYANIAIDIESKRISEKIKKEPLFIPIMARISIPFNLEEKEEQGKMTKQELMAKEHLENTTDITMNMGYVNLKKQKEKTAEVAIQKERG